MTRKVTPSSSIANYPEDGIFTFEMGNPLPAIQTGGPVMGATTRSEELFSHLDRQAVLDGHYHPEHASGISTCSSPTLKTCTISITTCSASMIWEWRAASKWAWSRREAIITISASTPGKVRAPRPLPLTPLVWNISHSLFPTCRPGRQFLGRLEELQLPYNQTEQGLLLTDPSQNGLLFQLDLLLTE